MVNYINFFDFESIMKPIFWSPTRYEVANLCLMKYHFQYISNVKAPLTPELALGIFLHKRKETLFKGNPGELEIKYKSAESFANAAMGIWKHLIIPKNIIQGKEIQWKFKGHQWALLNDIEELCIKTYNRCANEEPPLFIEYSRKFELNERLFDVRIDEIRKGYLIRDYKTGLSLPEELQIKHFPQFTFYALAFCCFAYQDKEFARICEINEDDRITFGGNPVYISEKINLEYYNVKKDVILPGTHRNNHDYEELTRSINTLESRLEDLESNIYPYWGRHCKYCQFKVHCDKKNSTGGFYEANQSPQLKLFPVKINKKFHDKTLKLFPRKKKVN